MGAEKIVFAMLVCALLAGLAFLALDAIQKHPVAFFAYGTVLSKNTMNARAGGFINATRADICGHELIFASQDARPTEFGVATAIPNDSSCILGALYYLTPEQMAALDKQSGVPSFYEKREVSVLLGSDVVKAQAYFLPGSIHRAPPSRTYYLAAQSGMEEWGYDAITLENVAGAD